MLVLLLSVCLKDAAASWNPMVHAFVHHSAVFVRQPGPFSANVFSSRALDDPYPCGSLGESEITLIAGVQRFDDSHPDRITEGIKVRTHALRHARLDVRLGVLGTCPAGLQTVHCSAFTALKIRNACPRGRLLASPQAGSACVAGVTVVDGLGSADRALGH